MNLIYCIVVTYNGKKWVDKCFSSLRESDYPIKTIVVDNGSTDGTQEEIRLKFPEVELIQSSENLGFGKANNIGINKAIEDGAEYVFLLNQDAYLYKGSIQSLIKVFELEPNAGIVSPIHLAGDRRNLDYNFFQYCNPKDTPDYLGDLVNGQVRNRYETKFINAAAWLLKSNVIKAEGVFHPIFDHYGEDHEYVARIQKKNYKVFISTECIIIHDRPQKMVSEKEVNKYAHRYKTRLLRLYCTDQCSEIEIDKSYLKILIKSVIRLNFKSFYTNYKNWQDLNLKIRKLKKHNFDDEIKVHSLY